MKYILAILSIVLATTAQILVKSASFQEIYAKKWIILTLTAVITYGVAFLFQSYVFRLFPLTKIGPSSAIAVMVLVFVCGVFLFGESLQLKQVIGIILGVISVYLIMS